MAKDSENGGKSSKTTRIVESTDRRKTERNSEVGRATTVRNTLKPRPNRGRTKMTSPNEIDAGKRKDLGEERWDLLFSVRRSIRYHARRRGFYEGLHSWVVFAALVFGSATFVAFGTAIVESWPLWAKLLPAAAVTVMAAADQAFGFMRKAWLHNDLAAEFTRLEQDLARAGDYPCEVDLHGFSSRRLDIEAREPPVKHVLNVICHNEVMRAEGYPPEKLAEIGFWQRALAHVVDFNEHRLRATH